jgi:hypothetical protein
MAVLRVVRSLIRTGILDSNSLIRLVSSLNVDAVPDTGGCVRSERGRTADISSPILFSSVRREDSTSWMALCSF